MNLSDIKTNPYHLFRFLKMSGGNVHKCAYISCEHCKKQEHDLCPNFICTFDADAKPLLMPASDANKLMKYSLDKDDYLTAFSSKDFCTMFSAYIEEKTFGLSDCPIISLYVSQNM